MKYLKFMTKHFLVLFLPLAFFSSCEEEVVVYDGEDFVHVENLSYNIDEESVEPLNITIYRTSGTGTETVTFDIDASFPEGIIDNPSDFYSVQPQGSLTFVDGEYEKDIVIFPVSNFVNTGVLQLEITLTGTDGTSTIGFPGESSAFSSTSVLISDDDCPFNTEGFIGSYSIEEFIPAANTGLAAAFGQSYQIDLAVDASDASGTGFILTNSAGSDPYLADGTTVKFSPCTGTVSFSSLSVAGWGTITDEKFVYDEDNFTISAAGDGIILRNSDGGDFGVYELVFTKL
jgi:hypothetical protein